MTIAEAKEIRIQFSDEKNTYRIYIERHLFKPVEVFVFTVNEHDGTADRVHAKIEVSASTLKEEIEFWLHELKRYVVKKKLII